MPFDAQAPAEVTARDRVIRLRDFLETLPDERFNMRDYTTGHERNVCASAGELLRECGTAACIAGWAAAMYDVASPPHATACTFCGDVGDVLGLSHKQAFDLFLPTNHRWPTWSAIPRSAAVAVLDHYLATGKIDWSVAK